MCAAAMDPWMAAVGYGSIDAGFLCAGAAGKDACYGDSGGPLTSDSGDQAVLIGAVSTGDGCAKVRILRGSPDKSGASHKYPLVQYSTIPHLPFKPNTYGVYSRISFYRGWLDTKMTSATFCPSGPNADTETSSQPNVATSTSTFSGIIIGLFSSHHHHFSSYFHNHDFIILCIYMLSNFFYQ